MLVLIQQPQQGRPFPLRGGLVRGQLAFDLRFVHGHPALEQPLQHVHVAAHRGPVRAAAQVVVLLLEAGAEAHVQLLGRL